jgi:hypothetical protein
LHRIIKILPFSFFAFSVFTSCRNNSISTPHKTDSVVVDTTKSLVQPEPAVKPKRNDGIPVFTVDDYPVTTKMFVGNYHRRESGVLASDDAAWFSNDTLNQTLIFELYTDFHRLNTYHFLNSDIPEDLVKNMGLHSSSGNPASLRQKLNDFKGFLVQVKKIPQSYFISYKGFKPGDSKEKIFGVYGKPDLSKIDNGIEKDVWKFTGDLIYDGKKDLKGKPLAEDNFGHSVTAYFRNNKLIAIILHNDIP